MIRLTSKRQLLVSFVIIATLFGGLQTGSAAQFIPIPSLEDASYTSAATAVSQDGRIVAGWSDSSEGIRAFRWTAASGVHPLGVGFMPWSMERRSQATAISADGKVVVGWTHYFDDITWGARKMAFLWTSESGFDLIPASANNNCIPRSLSADGSIIVGDSETTYNSSFAVIFHWDKRTETLLGGSTWTKARAVGVSHDGRRIAGSGVYNSTGYYPRVSYLHDETEGWQFIGDFTSDAFAKATALSGDGQTIAGILNATNSTVFRWNESTGLVDIGTFPAIANSQIEALNESGNIMVGTAGHTDHQVAIIWNESDGFQKLSDYAAQTLSIDLQGWQLTQANAITQCAIAGQGINPAGIKQAWVILFDIFGDANNDGDVDGQDLFAYTTEGNFDDIRNFTSQYGR